MKHHYKDVGIVRVMHGSCDLVQVPYFNLALYSS